MRTLAAAALCAALLAGCGGGSDGGKAVAHVGPEAITQKELDAVVAHFRNEFQLEGRSFPPEGTRAFTQASNQLLGLLVYRTELKQAARKLGVEADPNEIGKRLAATGAGEQEGTPGGDSFARDAVEVQILTEKIYAKVTAGVTRTTRAQTSQRRNQRMTAFLKRLRNGTEVRYEPGYAPGS
ncbi:MAG TPA: SurA N-terminal domain-containing protein [Gaiellaceae bacterium]|nr:SurA N-terminal domain-containing protein [Gaiellaceae bacterium]